MCMCPLPLSLTECYSVSLRLSISSLHMIFLLFHRQLSVFSAKVADYFIEILAGLRVWSNLNKLSIGMRYVRIQSKGHREIEEFLENFEAGSLESLLAFLIVINIELVLMSLIWEIRQLDISMISMAKPTTFIYMTIATI